MQLSKVLSIKTNLTKSINLDRDSTAVELLDNYVLTSTAVRGIQNIANTYSGVNSNKAWSLIGSYGSGKSSFALYLSHLLGNSKTKLSKAALKKLDAGDAELAKVIGKEMKGCKGYCEVLITGSPESLIAVFLKTLKTSLVDYYSNLGIIDEINLQVIDKLLDKRSASLSAISKLVVDIQKNIQDNGGKGLLIVIDELGKFLEYSARHESDDIFLLQVLAEITYDNDILLFVLLHQAFEQYGKNLSAKLKNEWTKIQGRYEVLSFVETTTQSLHMIGQVFQNKLSEVQLKSVQAKIKGVVKVLKGNGLLLDSLDAKFTNNLFEKCYPLHPTTALLLPTLCQKVAQNERTLFNYLGSLEESSLTKKINELKAGEFVMPADVFDYFLKGQILSNDSQLKRTVSEANTALDRFSADSLEEINLLKTIGLLNVVGTIPASEVLLQLCSPAFKKSIKNLKQQSIVNYRKFNNEYRVWQGSDFDINEELLKQDVQLSAVNIANKLNELEIFLPFVAKKYSIEKHSLFYFQPLFINTSEYKKHNRIEKNPRIIFCLSDIKKDRQTFEGELVQYFAEQDICVFLDNSEKIKQVTRAQVAIENIVESNPVIQQDPVVHRELKLYLSNAESETTLELNKIIENPIGCHWYQNKAQKNISSKRDIQKILSITLEDIYRKTPIIKNELINRNNPSAQANAGRRKLLIALLENSDKKDLDIEGYPAEKSMYRAILKNSGIHRKHGEKWGVSPPKDVVYLEVWKLIEKFFNSAKNQAKNFSILDRVLTESPFGIKKPVLPIFYIAAYLFNKDEVAVYEDRFYVPYFTAEHLERFLKRPDTFTFQQFKIQGVTQSFLKEYERGLLNGKEAPNAPKLFQAMSEFINDIPTYTKRTKNISEVAQRVRDAFKNNKSPQDLLFRKLPEACGYNKDNANGFGEAIKVALREIKNAYAVMVDSQIAILAEKLGISKEDKGQIKTKLVEYGQNLETYAIDEKTTKFIKAIGENNNDIDYYFERILVSISDKHPKEWVGSDSDFMKQQLSENIKLIINLDKIRAYHVKDELVDFQEIEIMSQANDLSNEAKIRIASKLLKSISIKTEERVNND